MKIEAGEKLRPGTRLVRLPSATASTYSSVGSSIVAATDIDELVLQCRPRAHPDHNQIKRVGATYRPEANNGTIERSEAVFEQPGTSTIISRAAINSAPFFVPT